MSFLDKLLNGLDQLDSLVPGDVECRHCKRLVPHDKVKRGLCRECRDNESED